MTEHDDDDPIEPEAEARIRVLVYEPGKRAGELREIPNQLASFQALVDGYIEAVSPWTAQLQRALTERGVAQTDPPALLVVCNEDGLRLGLPRNRYGFVGTFFVCRSDPPHMASLTRVDELIVRALYDGPELP